MVRRLAGWVVESCLLLALGATASLLALATDGETLSAWGPGVRSAACDEGAGVPPAPAGFCSPSPFRVGNQEIISPALNGMVGIVGFPPFGAGGSIKVQVGSPSSAAI